MRPLHRPMFRYGGPIKEGIMSGIREPHAGGGRAALVGNPVYPQTGGREHHADYWKNLWAAGKPILKSWATPWKKPKKVVQQVPKIAKVIQGSQPVKNLQGIFVKKATSPGITSSGAGQTFMKNLKSFSFPGATKALGWAKKAKDVAFKYPKSTAAGVLYGGPTVIGGVKQIPWSKIGQGLDPRPGWRKVFGIEDKIDEKDEKILDEKITEKVIEKIVPKVPQKTEEEKRAERIQKYRDIMDIKGMNKQAAYKSLVDASKLVSESGDFKGDIKSGKLINQVIQAASKQFEKPAKTKDAIDTLILKGEIEADIASGKAGTYQKNIDTVASNLNISKEDATKMILNKPLNLREQVTSDMAATKQAAVTHRGVVSSTKKQYPKAQVMLTQDEYEKEVGDDSTGEAFVKTVVTDKLSKDPGAKVAGVYIVGKEVVQVDGAGNTLTLFP